MSFYKNPIIGWYVKKRLKNIILLLILTFFLFYLLLSNYSYKISYGCKRPDCYSTPCTGYKCRASGCVGNNCKAGDCYGELCEAGDCKGIGCRAGDCYGLNCIPGKAIDPTCQGDKKLRGACNIFAFNGKAYNLPSGSMYPIVKYLPKNSAFNPDYCSDKKKTNIFTNEKYIYNFNVDYINLFTSGLKKLEDVKYKDNISQTGKSFIINNDLFFTYSIPNVYKSNNCEWCTDFKNKKIVSDYKPNYNNNQIEWIPKNKLVNPTNAEGKEDVCNYNKEHNMKILNNQSVISQIKYIQYNNNETYLQNFLIDDIKGEIINTICTNCSKRNVQYLDITSHPTDFKNEISSCMIRNYELEQITDNFGEVINHKPINFTLFKKKSIEFEDYLLKNPNTLKTFKEHHLFVYKNTINNTQIYQCYWCNVSVKVDYDTLPRKNNLELDSCITVNDYNHYMYYQIDKNKNVYMSCLKCNKNSLI
jgi:hypothetical protein